MLLPAHTELDRFQRKATPWFVGAAALQVTDKSPPCIVWVNTGGSTVPLDENEDGFYTAHTATLEAFVWTRDEDRDGSDALALFLNLQLACKRLFADRISWGNHSCDEATDPKGQYRGSLIKATATLTISVSDQPQQVTGYPSVLDDYAERVCLDTFDTTAEDA